MISLSTISLNKNNPRFIRDEKFKKLVSSLAEFPKMMELRPIVIDENNVILGGNMRYRALMELGILEVPDNWIKKASDLTDTQKREFLLKDNVGFGEWDWDIIADQWQTDEVTAWGLDIPDLSLVTFGEKNKEIDIDEMDGEMIIKLKFPEENYHLVKGKLGNIAATPEDAVMLLLAHWESLKLISNGEETVN
jgi:hypothetical protein